MKRCNPEPHSLTCRATPLHVINLVILLVLSVSNPAANADVPWPSFTATTLQGEKVNSDKLIGQPTLLIITPSRDAAQSTREWVTALRKEIDQSRYRIRDVLAVDLPFFMSEEDAIVRAKEKVPKQYHDQTWILDSQVIEKSLGIPKDSSLAALVVLDEQGDVVTQVHGSLTGQRLNKVTSALQTLP